MTLTSSIVREAGRAVNRRKAGWPRNEAGGRTEEGAEWQDGTEARSERGKRLIERRTTPSQGCEHRTDVSAA